MESVSQLPLFRDDRRGAQVFPLVFVWVVFFVTAWQVLILLGAAFDAFCFVFVIGVGITFLVVVVQAHVSEKVYPLLYITPLVDMIMLQVIAGIGFTGGSGSSLAGFFSLIVFLIATNCVILALAWDEMANRSTSGVSGLWMCIMPVACLLMLSASAILRFGLEWVVDGAPVIQWAIWPTVWLAIAFGLIALFVKIELRQALPSEERALPAVLLAWSLLTFIVGPLVIVLMNFSMTSILVVITSGIAQFGVASADLEALMRVPAGRVAVGCALAGGYIMTLVCSLFAWTFFMYQFGLPP